MTRFETVELDDGQMRELTETDLDDLQALLERCRDYYLLHHDRPPIATEARDEWDEVPDGVKRNSKHLLGLFASHLCGLVEVVRDWPRRGTWNIGLLLLEPAARGRRTGTRVMEIVDGWAARSGADTLRISVMPANTGGMAFWRRLGFEQVPAVGEHPSAIALERRVAIGA